MREKPDMLQLAIEMGLTEKEYIEITKLLGHTPSLIELGIFSLNWSEHCSYKSSKPLLKRLPSEGRFVVQGPGENAGIVEIGDSYCVVFKVESHNHPSYIEPFNGAATGIGGIIRDILSVGARPIALLDSLRFGELEKEDIQGLFDGVVKGISFYGNCIGVPTVGGEVYFEHSYSKNCLVNVMAVGLIRKDTIKRSIAKGIDNPIILVGAKTGRDGIHGATFASQDLLGDTQKKRSNVQIGDPFVEKLLIEAVLEASNVEGIIGVQDLGAGGLSTALPEMAHKGEVGIEVYLDKVPLRTNDLTPYEIVLSESQERMVLCIEKGKEKRVMDIFKKWGLEAEFIGRVIETPVFRIFHRENLLTEIDIKDLLEGTPPTKLTTRRPSHIDEPKQYSLEKNIDIKDRLLKLLSSENIASKRWVFEQYDYSVQTNTILSPGNGDAAVLRVKDKPFAIALTIDCNGRYVYLNPYEGAKIAVCESARNLVSTGAEPRGITDCLNFANPNDPEVYWSFEQVIEGLREASQCLCIPFVSGNVSFYNQSDKEKIYPTPTIGMVGVIKDIKKVMTPSFKKEGDRIYVLGKESGNIGGSEFLKIFYNTQGGEIDTVELDFEKRLHETILYLIENSILRSVHDISEGGVLTAIAESAIWGNSGAVLKLDSLSEEFLFGEWQSRFLASVSREKEENFTNTLRERNIPFDSLGEVSGDVLLINDKYRISLSLLRDAYLNRIERIMEK